MPSKIEEKCASIIQKHGHYCPLNQHWELSTCCTPDGKRVQDFAGKQLRVTEMEEIIDVWS